MTRKQYFCITLFLVKMMALLIGQGNLPPVGADWEARYTNGIAAVVNKDIITVDQLRSELKLLVPEIRRISTTEAEFNQRLEELSFEVLRNMINRFLIVQDFEEKGFNIPKVYIEKEYDDYIAKEFNGDRAAFLKWLKAESKAPSEFRKELKDKMIVDFMRSRMKKSESAVSPARITNYYESNKEVLFYDKEGIHLHQIMLALEPNKTTADLVAQAEEILNHLRAGVPFAELAKKHSKDDLASKGGDYGWIERKELSQQLSNVAFGLKVGEFSTPIEKEGYVFLFYVQEKRAEGVQPLPKVQAQIEEVLAAESAREARKVWLERLRENAYIRYYL